VVLSEGRVLEEIRVDLPRPRSWDALHEDERFKEVTGRVLQLVRSA
jgi:NitT/TauT family transport system ATP-binding protein